MNVEIPHQVRDDIESKHERHLLGVLRLQTKPCRPIDNSHHL